MEHPSTVQTDSYNGCQENVFLGVHLCHINMSNSVSYLIQVWQKIEDVDWRPQTYLELEGLPCILIFSGMDPQGESLPR